MCGWSRSGFSHLWLMPAEGGTPRPITQGSWDVRNINAVDTDSGYVYFTAAPDNPCAPSTSSGSRHRPLQARAGTARSTPAAP